MNDNAKLVARIANTSPIAFETAMDNVSEEEGHEDVPQQRNAWATIPNEMPLDEEEDVPILNKPQEPVEEEEPETEQSQEEQTEQPESVPDQQEESDDDQFSKYSEAALVAMQLKEARQDIFEDVPEDMNWEALLEKIDNYIADTINTGSEYQMQQIGQANQYVKFLLEGGSPEVLQQAVEYADLTNVDINEADDQLLEQIVSTNLANKGLSRDDIDTVIKTSKLQKQLRSKAKVMQDELKEREQVMMEEDRRRREAQKYQQEQYRRKIISDINEIIESDVVRGYPLNDSLRSELKNMIFEPSIVVEENHQGKKVTRRITEFEKLKRAFDQDIEQQIAFAIWLKNGGRFDATISEEKKNNRLLEELRRRENKSSMPRVTKNRYIQD